MVVVVCVLVLALCIPTSAIRLSMASSSSDSQDKQDKSGLAKIWFSGFHKDVQTQEIQDRKQVQAKRGGFVLPPVEERTQIGSGCFGVAYLLHSGPFSGRVVKVVNEERIADGLVSRADCLSHFLQEHEMNLAVWKALRERQLDTRFFQETELLTEADSENLVILSDYFDTNLDTFLRSHPNSPAFDSIGQQFTQAVEILHLAGFSHNDLNRYNVCISPSNQLKLIDFGNAVPTDPNIPPSAEHKSLDEEMTDFIVKSLSLGEANRARQISQFSPRSGAKRAPIQISIDKLY